MMSMTNLLMIIYPQRICFFQFQQTQHNFLFPFLLETGLDLGGGVLHALNKKKHQLWGLLLILILLIQAVSLIWMELFILVTPLEGFQLCLIHQFHGQEMIDFLHQMNSKSKGILMEMVTMLLNAI